MLTKPDIFSFDAPLFLDGMESAAELRNAFASAPRWLVAAVQVIADSMDVQYAMIVGESNRRTLRQLRDRFTVLLRTLMDSELTERNRKPLVGSLQVCTTIFSDIYSTLGDLANADTCKSGLNALPVLLERQDKIREDIAQCHKAVIACAQLAYSSLTDSDSKQQAEHARESEVCIRLLELLGRPACTSDMHSNVSEDPEKSLPTPRLTPEMKLLIDLDGPAIADPTNSSCHIETNVSTSHIPDPLGQLVSTSWASSMSTIDLLSQDVHFEFEDTTVKELPSKTEIVPFRDAATVCKLLSVARPNTSPPIGAFVPVVEADDLAAAQQRSTTALGISGEEELRMKVNKEDQFVPPDLTKDIVPCLPYGPSAQGGFADIWQAEWKQEPKKSVQVAVKVLRINFNATEEDLENMRKRFRAELRVWQELRHANVLRLQGTCTNFGDHFPALVSLWFPKGNAIIYLRNLKSGVTAAVRLTLLYDAAKGLEYLHSYKQPIIHGDLSTSNILVNNEGEACLCDFGLSKIWEDAGTSCGTSTNGGTARYMAPELIDEGSSRSFETDIFSFGCVAYEILSGMIPYHQKRTDHQVILHVWQGGQLLQPSDDVMPQEWWDFIQLCCSRRPEDRPTATQVVECLRSFRNDVVGSVE